MIPRYWYWKGLFPMDLFRAIFPYIRLSKSCPDFETKLDSKDS